MSKKGKRLWAVFATPAPGSSETDRRLVTLVDGAKELAQKAALADFCDNWVQGNWEEYDGNLVVEFKKAIRAKKWEEALKILDKMSGYVLEIEEHYPVRRVAAPKP